MKPNSSCLANESGSVLVMVMIVLIALTALSLTMINFTTQETKMAGHYKFDKVAFYNGDSGIYGTPKFIRLLFTEGEAVPAEDPAQAACVQYLNAGGGADEEILNRIFGFEGQDTTAALNDTPEHEQNPLAADISMNGCRIPADINIVPMGPEEVSGAGREFAAGGDGLGSGGGDQAVRFRLVSTGSDDQNNTHTIRALYRWKSIPGGL
ncbi:MAG: pilus assembly PilX N-terminal domain-containing protein [Desulfatitalea sp.]